MLRAESRSHTYKFDRLWFDPTWSLTIYCIRSDHANHYTTDTVLRKWGWWEWNEFPKRDHKKSHKLKLIYKKIMANKYTNIKKWSITSRFKKKKTTTYDVVNRDSVLDKYKNAELNQLMGFQPNPFDNWTSNGNTYINKRFKNPQLIHFHSIKNTYFHKNEWHIHGQ
jgi:hypothetical protein